MCLLLNNGMYYFSEITSKNPKHRKLSVGTLQHDSNHKTPIQLVHAKCKRTKLIVIVAQWPLDATLIENQIVIPLKLSTQPETVTIFKSLEIRYHTFPYELGFAIT